MDAPTCRTCGKRHWSRLCGEPAGRHAVSDFYADPNPKRVARNENVAPAAVAPADLKIALVNAMAMIDRLTGEVRYLKMLLAGKPGERQKQKT